MSTSYTNDNSQVVSVWSAYGHHFMSDGGENTESCLRCGAMYQLLALEGDPTRGEYTTASGEEPAECTGDTSMVHGYLSERDCDSCHGTGCAHCEHSCPCIACDS